MNIKKLIPSLIIGLILATAGFFIGRETGFADGYKSCEINYKFSDVEKIREDIKMIEGKNIIAFLEAKAGIITKKEGPIFKKHREAYFSGTVNNNAAWSVAGNIKLKIDFYTEENILISSDTVSIIDSIAPSTLR